MNNELKPCPFCGGKAEKMVNDDRASHLFIWCTSCGISTDVYFAEDLKEAVAAWNRRAPTIDPGRPRGRWEKDLDAIKCSACGFGMFPIGYFFMNGECTSRYFRPPYCPNCGAKMESEGSI